MTAPVAASGEYGSVANSSMDFTATTKGALGNSVTIAYVDDGTADSETVTVSGLAVTVHMEAANSTSTMIKTAWDGTAAATAIATCANHSGHNGSGKPGALAAAPLSGGSDGHADHLVAAVTLTNRKFASDAILQGFADANVGTVLTNARAAGFRDDKTIPNAMPGGILGGVNR